MIVNDIYSCQLMITDGSCAKSSRPWVPLRSEAQGYVASTGIRRGRNANDQRFCDFEMKPRLIGGVMGLR